MDYLWSAQASLASFDLVGYGAFMQVTVSFQPAAFSLKTLTMHRCGVHTLSISTFFYSHQH
jgi:hypothetical protein